MQDVPTESQLPVMRIFIYFAVAWLVLFLTLVGYVDFDPANHQLIQISDYLMTFHTAGYALTHGQLASLYPPEGAVQFAGMPFDRLAHTVLPEMPAPSVAEFMYMPLAAAVFAPFSHLPLNISLFCWQVVSLFCLWASMVALVAAPERGSSSRSAMAFKSSLFSLFLLPACVTIWIGQVGLVFGVLPLSLGYFLLRRKYPTGAGLVWALCFLKPQFLVPLALPMLCELFRARFKLALGFAAGVLLLASTSLALFSPRLNLEWLRCLEVSDHVYSDLQSGVSRQIATSLPRTLILMLSPESQLVFKPLIYGLAALIFFSAVFLVWRLCRVRMKNDSSIVSLSLLLGVFMTPLVVPHMFLYDFCLFAVSAPIAFNELDGLGCRLEIKRLVIAGWLLIDIYTIVVMAAAKMAVPLPFVILLLVLFSLMYKCVLLTVPDSSLESVPTSP